MEETALNIFEIIKDYRNDDGIYLQVEDVIAWAEQFDDDAEFILSELNYILPQVYVSKETAKQYIKGHIEKLVSEYNCANVSQFLSDTEFLDLQPVGKSQNVILNLLNEVLEKEYGLSYRDYNTFPKRNFVYFDDVLATGGTIGRNLVTWLGKKADDGDENYKKILANTYRLSINLFCSHSWGQSFLIFRLKKEFDDKIAGKILWRHDYLIENHAKFYNQSLNIAIPVENQPANAKLFLENLDAVKYEDYAYRKESTPKREGFFTTPENRIRYENLLLQKGLRIIKMIKGEVKPNIRPLGLVNPNYKIYGLGTHFFTWRNIPNNSPLVFWWNVEGHDWKPLFPVGNRGN